MTIALACSFAGCSVAPLDDLYDGGLVTSPDTGVVLAPDGGVRDGGVPDSGVVAPPSDAGGVEPDDGGPVSPPDAMVLFPYVPSNFMPTADTGFEFNVLAGTICEIDTTSATFSLGCPDTAGILSIVLMELGEAVLLEASEIHISGTLAAFGARPIIFAAHGNATVAGELRAGGSASFGGPGANPAECGRGEDGRAVTSGPGGGGGGGGGYGTVGATGGTGFAGAAPGGRRGITNGNAEIVPLRGGCSGGTGARRNGLEGMGGGGGGGIQISVAGELYIPGIITVSGGGGLPGESSSGGGGGGSGGAILLEANILQLSPRTLLLASGGGAAGGNGPGETATAGDDGNVDYGIAAGGSGGGGGGPGGNGGFASFPPMEGRGSPFGGGGGGGGSGRIHVNASCVNVDAARIAPSYTGC